MYPYIRVAIFKSWCWPSISIGKTDSILGLWFHSLEIWIGNVRVVLGRCDLDYYLSSTAPFKIQRFEERTS